MRRDELSNVRNPIAVTLIAACGLYIFRWVFYPEATFYNDDWTWLARAVFTSWSSMLHIWTFLPNSLFADRPVEEAGIRLLYQIFELDHTGYAAAILAVHVANAVLLYLLAAQLLSSRFYAMIAGTLFVIDYSVAYPAYWLATLADSASLFFCLCAFLTFVSGRAYASLVAALFYYLAVKSKEVALPFPLLLLVHSFIVHLTKPEFADFAKAVRAALRSTWPLLAVFGVLFGFSMYYFAAATTGGMQGYGPYVPQFDLPTLLTSTTIYLQAISFYRLGPNEALIGFAVLIVIAILTLDRTALVGITGFFVATGPVLFLPTQRMPYYAYAGSAYIALMLVALMQRVDRWLSTKLGVVAEVAAKAAVLLMAVWFTQLVYARSWERDAFIGMVAETAKAIRTLLLAVPSVENKSKIVVTGLPQAIHLFTHDQCLAPRVMYKIPELDCRIEGSDADLTALYERLPGPKILLHYDGGNVSLRARSP